MCVCARKKVDRLHSLAHTQSAAAARYPDLLSLSLARLPLASTLHLKHRHTNICKQTHTQTASACKQRLQQVQPPSSSLEQPLEHSVSVPAIVCVCVRVRTQLPALDCSCNLERQPVSLHSFFLSFSLYPSSIELLRVSPGHPFPRASLLHVVG